MNMSLAIQIDKKYFPCAHGNTFDYLSILKNSGFKFSFENATHFGEDGHIFFANFLYKTIGKLYD